MIPVTHAAIGMTTVIRAYILYVFRNMLLYYRLYKIHKKPAF